jgi:tetratricopeptide (TPR) repeat protein
MAFALQSASQTQPAPPASQDDQLTIHRNLGKAFYENPITHEQAVEEFRLALELAPDSVRERINYGLALLRGGRPEQGIAELERAQQQNPSIPHTWFNLGIEFKKAGNYERALEQFLEMVRLVPDEPISQYNLGYLYRLMDQTDNALRHFEEAARLDPALAGPHFQLFNAYRAAGRTDDANRELQRFQEIRRQQQGSAIPEDLDWSFYSEVYETVPPAAARDAEQVSTELQFTGTQLGTGFDPETAGLLTFDFNGDGRADLLAWSAGGARLFRDGAALVDDAGFAGLEGIRFVASGDFNNDGSPDLCVVTESGALLYVNRQGLFERSPAQLPEGRYAKAVWVDYDHDYDLDLILLGERQALVRNNGEAGFSDRTADFPFVGGVATEGVVFDVVPYDIGFDLAVAYEDRAGVLYRDRLSGRYEAQPLGIIPSGTTALSPRDMDNDGWTDLATGGPEGTILLHNREGTFERIPSPASAGPFAWADFENRGYADLVIGGAVFRNRGLGQFLAANSPSGGSATALAESDFNRDGKSDLAAVLADGSLRLFRNDNPAPNSWLEVRLTGVRNLQLAPAAKVEIRAGSLYHKQLYTGAPLTFGLASQAQIETVRITWPNGLIQNEIRQPVREFLAIREAQRLSGSCPMIFTWDGSRFEFITDVLGVAPLGASAGDGKYFPVDHDEFIQIPGRALVPVDSRYEVRITEELREVAFLDQVRLIAVDHPSDVEIFTNDKFKSPPFPEFRLFGVPRRIYPRTALDHRGQDVLPRLLRRDATYPDSFRRGYNGIAELHTLDLDFGDASRANRAALVLSGWLDWADGSTYRAVSQESSDSLVMPYLQVQNAAGEWQTVIEDMGLPAGKPKTIVVDLTGKFLSASRKVRIVTSLSLYWDEIFLAEQTDAPQAVLTEVEAESADLRFRGFSRPVIHPERKQPERFEYHDWMPASMWNPTPGLYTRYGDVRPLTRAVDDLPVVMGSGDELRLLFPAASLPPLPPGWQRDFLLKVDGWAKDADANTAYGQSVEPLPFHGMSQYPYPPTEQFPDDELHRRYREEYNTRPALRLLRPLTEISSGTRSRP